MKQVIVAIGSSSGGVDALKIVLSAFKRPSNLSVLVVLHFPPDGKNLLPELYRDICDFDIKEAEMGETIRPETIYFAPPDYHLSAEENLTLSLSSEEMVNFSRPSIDVLMDSVAVSFGKDAVGVLLTGANHDGAKGMQKIFEHKGVTIVQDPAEAVFKEMPLSCLKLFNPTQVLPLSEIHTYLTRLSGASV